MEPKCAGESRFRRKLLISTGEAGRIGGGGRGGIWWRRWSVIVELPEVVVDPKVRGLCVHPYPGHPKGCPNFNRKAGCPPKCPPFTLRPPYVALVNEFDLAAHVERMRAKHPTWSMRQFVNCLYWQPGARAQLRRLVVPWLREHRGWTVASCPEAGGVNVTATLSRVGIQLEWPPRRIARQVVIAGHPA